MDKLTKNELLQDIREKINTIHGKRKAYTNRDMNYLRAYKKSELLNIENIVQQPYELVSKLIALNKPWSQWIIEIIPSYTEKTMIVVLNTIKYLDINITEKWQNIEISRSNIEYTHKIIINNPNSLYVRSISTINFLNLQIERKRVIVNKEVIQYLIVKTIEIYRSLSEINTDIRLIAIQLIDLSNKYIDRSNEIKDKATLKNTLYNNYYSMTKHGIKGKDLDKIIAMIKDIIQI